MSTQTAELQQAIYALLDGKVIVGGSPLPIWDAVPENETAQRYVTIGDTVFIPFDTKLDSSKDNQRATVTIHSWTRDYEGRLEVKKIMDAVYGVLNRATLSLTNYSSVLVRGLSNGNTIRDPQGNMYHGINTFDIILNAN